MSKYPSYELARVLFDYDEGTGVLTWKPRDPVRPADKMFNTRYAGKEVGFINPEGYRACSLKGKAMLMLHRIIFIWMTGSCPEEVDHTDGDRLNNRWANLREATKGTNQQNAAGWGKYMKGVSYQGGRRKPWYAAIRINGVLKHLGTFHTELEAGAAYKEAAAHYFGEFHTTRRVDQL